MIVVNFLLFTGFFKLSQGVLVFSVLIFWGNFIYFGGSHRDVNVGAQTSSPMGWISTMEPICGLDLWAELVCGLDPACGQHVGLVCGYDLACQSGLMCQILLYIQLDPTH